MDQVAAMRSFRKVLELGSFSAAARQLGLSKAAVSKQVSELEAYLGATLIHRTTRRLHPTDAGQAYFESAVGLLDELEAADAAVRHLQSEPAGTLRISVPSAFGQVCLSAMLSELGRRHPKLTVAVEATDRLVDLVEEGFDAAIRIRATLPDSTLIAKRIRQIPIRWRDLDPLGHVNSAVYVTLFEAGRDQWLREVLGSRFGADQYVIARIELDFRAEIDRDTPYVESRHAVEAIGTSSVTLQERLINPAGAS